MWGARRTSFLSGKAGSSFRTVSGCRRLGGGFGTSIEATEGALAIDELVSRNGVLRYTRASASASLATMAFPCEIGDDHKLGWVRFSGLNVSVAESVAISLSSAIRECGLLGWSGRGIGLHCMVIKVGYQDQLFIASNLITMYSKCAEIESARRVFDEMSVHDTVSWNAMVASYLRSELYKEAICMFSIVLGRTRERMALVNQFTLSSILRACASWGGAQVGRPTHAVVLKLNFEWDLVVMVSLMDMYARHGSFLHARLIFDKMEERDVIAWNSLISGYVQGSHGEEAIRVFQKMRWEGFLPNEITFTSLLGAFAGAGDSDLGRCLHANVIKCGYISDLFVGTALINMYSKFLEIENAEKVFTSLVEINLISYNALITGYGLMGRFEKAFLAYIQVLRNGMRPDNCTFVAVLLSCSLKYLGEGSQVNCHIVKFGLDSDASVGNSLVSFYAKCNMTGSAALAFECIFKPNAICWTGIISCLVQNHEGEKAVMYFQRMHAFSEMPDEFSLSVIFKALADLAAAEQGKHLHALTVKVGLESALFVGSSLVDMYCKCGMVEDSIKMFNSMPQKNITTWNAIIVGLAQNGLCKKSMLLFQEMMNDGIVPNFITFIGVLVACSHAGLVDEGKYYFNLMVSSYEISPTIEHYTCMVDLLGRMGYWHEAGALLKNCCLSQEPAIWRSVIGSCGTSWIKERKWQAFEKCVSLEAHSSGTLVLLSNLCASEGLWCDVIEVRNLMKKLGIKKKPGFSWIEIRNKVHIFSVEQESEYPDNMMTTLLTIHFEIRLCSN